MQNATDVRVQNDKTEPLKLFSLRKQISGFFFCFFSVVLILWIVLMAVSIRSYQTGQDEKRLNDLAAYAQVLDDNIMQLNDVIGSIYTTNSAFSGITQYKSVIDKCAYMYELLNFLQIQVGSNSNLSAMFVYYDNFNQALNRINKDMSFETKEVLRSQGNLLLKNTSHSYETYMAAIDTEVYYNVFLKKAASAVGGSTRLDLGLPNEQESSASYGVICDGVFYRTSGEYREISNEMCTVLNPGKNEIEDMVIYVHQLGTTDIAVVELLPSNLWMYISWVHIVVGVLGIVVLLLAIRIRSFLSDQMTKPLEDMTKALGQIQTGIWEVNFTVPNRIEEIEDVRQTVKMMLGEIERYKIMTYEEQLDKQKTQLQYLQLQLAPHFYTNCLKNAYCMLMLKEYENVGQFLLCMSTHLRYLLQKDKQLVTVSSERDFVLNYIKLQKQTTSKSIICDIAVDEEALELEIPILALQTFVENSVKYARDMNGSDLNIVIHVQYRETENNNYLDIDVKDFMARRQAGTLRIIKALSAN